jgi:hypothetical protein
MRLTVLINLRFQERISRPSPGNGGRQFYLFEALGRNSQIDNCGLTMKVMEAQKERAVRLEESIIAMSEFGMTRGQLTAMADEQLRSHAETTRQVLVPSKSTKEVQPLEGATRMNESEMKAELERLRAENAQLKTKDKGGISLKLSDKGALSLYGMGRFPVTLYKEQWLRVLANAVQIEAFIRENEAKLKTKE